MGVWNRRYNNCGNRNLPGHPLRAIFAKKYLTVIIFCVLIHIVREIAQNLHLVSAKHTLRRDKMALKKISDDDRYEGFMDLVQNNYLEGVVECERVTGLTDNGKERGTIGIRTRNSVGLKLDGVQFEGRAGDLVGVNITGATRVLLGCKGKLVSLKFEGFGPAKPGQKPFHRWEICVDDGT